MSLLDDLKKKAQEFGGKVQEAARQELQRREAAGEDVSTTSTRESVRENLQTAFEPITKAANSLKERFTYRDYSAKNQQSKKWYKGDTPTHSETLARIYQLGEEDPSQREELWNLYQQEASNPTSPLYERYGQATSQYMTALGLTADQVNDDFFAANADLFGYGVTTAAGNLSTAKRNGAEALLAADLKGLYDDYQKTKALQAEQDQAMKEAKYWMAQGLTDDEIKAKLNIGGANSKYKTLYKAIEKTATGEYEPTTAPIQLLTSYGVDGMLYSLRNPDSSTGDYLLDAVQREMGRGVKGPEVSDSRRDMTSASYAPYAVGMASMDEYGIKYNRTSFDRDWLNSPEGLAVRNNPETTKDYAAIWEAVENTETYKTAVDEFNTDVRAMIEAGASPEEIFSSEMLDDYPEVKKLYEAQQKGMPLKTASAIDFDISAMYDEADKAYKANVGKISSEAYDTDVSAKLGTPSTRTAATAGTQTQTAEQMRVARSIFAPYATPSELNVFKTIGPSYGDTKGAVLNGITNGTSGDDQAYLSATDAADMYAAEFYLPSVQKMNSLNREKELFDKYEAFLAEWEPRLAKEGPGLMGTDEFKAAQAEIEAAEAVWDKYDGSPDELNAAIENEKKIQQNIDRKYGDAQLLNKNGITGLSVKPMLDFAAQFESFVPGRYADTEWGARMSKGESWDAVSKDMEKAKASNDQLLLMIDTTLKQAEKFGINEEYTAGLKRAQEALLEENQLIELTSARGNKDYSSRIAEVDDVDLHQAVASADVNLLPDRIMMAVFSPDTLARKMTDNTVYEELALAPRMTEQEVNDYKYYLAESPEKAAEYYNALTPMLRVRAAQEMEEQAASDVDTIGGSIGASIASVLVNTAQGFMLPSMALKSAAGEEIDPYSIEFLPSLYSQTARSEIKGNIKGKFGDGSWQEKALNFAYDAVMTGADSTAAAMVGGGVGGLAIQSSSAAMSTLMDVKMRGGTDEQAWAMAGITAAAEAASEYLPMENLSKMMSKGVKSGFKTELLKQISSDAPGEMLSELVGSVSDQVIMQELSNWEASYNQYVASGLSDEEARKQADLDVWKGIGYAGLLSVGTSTGSVALAAGIGKAKNTFFKSRAETVLSEATAKGASKADQTATVSAAMESMGVDPVEADAAAQAMASVDPNAAATVQSILVHTEDPAVVDAIRLGSVLPGSQTGKALTLIQQEGATDENVQALVETAQAENAVPEIQNQYETALTSSVEAMASVNAMLGSDNSNVAAAKEAVTQAEQNLKVQQQSIAEAEGEMQAATSVLQNAKKRFNAKPADQKAKASVIKAIARYQQAQEHLEQVRATTDIAKAQEDLKAARAGLESARNEALTAARQAAQPVVQETMAQREQRKLETLPYVERFSKEFDKWDKKQIGKEFVVGHTSDTLLSLGVPDADINLLSDKLIKIQKKHPAMTDEVIKQIPNIIENPVVVMKSRTVPDRLTMFGEVMDANGNPVLAIIDTSMKANTKTGRIDIDVIRLNSAYGKDTDTQGFIDRSEVVYVDKNRADNWSRSTRLYLPIGEDTNGSGNSIAQSAETVNTSVPVRETENAEPAPETAENVNSESSELVANPSQDLVNNGSGIVPPGGEGGAQQPSGRTGKRQFANQTLQNSDAMPEWLKQELRNNPAESDYEVDSNYQQAERAWNTIQQNGYEQERDRLINLERFSPDDTAEANLLMAMANHNGDAETLLSIASAYNREGTKAGQELQARKLFSKMSPTGAKAFVAGQAETRLKEFLSTNKVRRDRLNASAENITQQLLALPDTELSSDNRWGVELNGQQQELIRHYHLENVARPGLHYNRATTKQRMLEAIIATPAPMAMTGNGLNLVQRLEYMDDGLAVVTNADLDYIGTQLAQFVGLGGEVGGRDADLAVSRAYEAFGNITPATAREKMRTWRYTSMLLSVTSAIRNVIGNTAQNLENATAHGVASMVDRVLAQITGERTVANINMQERIEGWRGFVDETKNTFRDYFVDQSITQRGEAKYDTHQRGRVYQSQTIETMRNMEGFLMSVGDRNFWRKAYLNSIAEQQRLAELNGTTLTMDEMEARAEADANYATFTEDSKVRDALSSLKQIPGLGDVLDFILPFTGVPINITKRMWQYSPFGLAGTLLNSGYQAAVRKGAKSEAVQGTKIGRKLTRNAKDFDQRAFVMSVSRGLTGTALFGVGMALAKMGAIKLGTGDEEDAKKYGLRSAMGEQYTPYVYNPFTDEYVSLAAFAPAVSPLIMGATAADIFAEDENTWMAIQNAALASIDQIFDASFMSGLSDLFSSNGSPGEKVANAIFTNAVSQSVPALFSQLSAAIDPYVRDTKDKNWIMQALKAGLISRIPGLRQMLPEKVDVSGHSVRTKEGWKNFIDPFTTTDVNDDPALQELIRLSDDTGETSFLPSDALSGSKMTLTVSGQDVTLDGHQKETYKKRYGQLWLEGGTTINKKGQAVSVMGVRAFMNTPTYQSMTDEERTKQIQKIVKAAKEGASMEMLNEIGPDPEEE